MTLPGIFPTWLGECEGEEGTGLGGTTIIDSFEAILEGDVEVAVADDTISIIIEDEIVGETDQGGITGVVGGDIDVDLECS